MPEKMTDTSSGMRKMTMQMKTLEVEVVRVKITLACTECKQRNYNMTKEKKNHPERMETQKMCIRDRSIGITYCSFSGEI